MGTYGNSAAQINTTISQHIKGEIIATVRNNYFLNKLESNGQIRTGMYGRRHEWRLRHKRNPMRSLGDGGTIIFNRPSRNITLVLDYVGKYVSESITEQDKEMNKGDARIVDIWSGAVDRCMEDFRFWMHAQIWTCDGNASGSRDFSGFPTWHSAAVNASSVFGTNNDTYAGKSTARGALGGSFTGTPFWPFGQSDPQYDAHTPVIIDYRSPLAFESGGWESDIKTWSNTASQALRLGIMCAERVGEPLDCNHLGWNMYRQFKDSVAKDTRLVYSANTDPKTMHLGLQTITYDGVEVRHEDGIPSDHGYGVKYKNIEFLSLYKKLAKSDTDFALESSSDRCVVKALGQLKFKKLNGCIAYRPLS